MSKHRLKVTLTDQPEPDAAVSARKVSIRSRIARKLLGDPSSSPFSCRATRSAQLKSFAQTDDLMALAHAA